LSDVNFYLDILGEPVFSVQSSNSEKTDWLVNELERLGFAINDDKAKDSKTKATHTFYLEQSQRTVNNHNGKAGVETALVVKLKDNSSGDILFTVMNDPLKSRIYVKPIERAGQVSQISAYKKLKKKLGIEVVQALAKYSEQGRIYQIVIRGAKRSDVDLFKHVLNNGSAGQVENWQWRNEGREMTLGYRFQGTLSSALDQWLEELYQTFRDHGRSRRPHMIRAEGKQAIFEMVQK
ncbi:hypothetical protein, partial [Endozoicomonas sp.]|uniref:hypothetical protein n=1 Tax=Endozoicomonas sp. TaxID=1892382 RepID=UPI00383AE2AB